MSSSLKQPVRDLLADLVRINSVNPEWGGPGEGAVADYVIRHFEEIGMPVERQEVLPGRPNVIATLPGRDRDRSLLFEVHMDTVGTEAMTIDPFDPRIEDGRMWGRGSCDVKGSLAAIMQTLTQLKQVDYVPGVDVVMAAVVDEEHHFRGVSALIDSFERKPEAAVVAEPTEMNIACANKGVLRWRIVAHGKSAHSSKPDLGADAISAMADVVRAIADDAGRLRGHSHPLVGSPTCNVGLIEGGEQVNFVPAHCAISLDRRLVPGEVIAEVMREYESLLEPVRQRHPKVQLEMEKPSVEDAAMETPVGEKIVGDAGFVADHIGMTSKPIGVPYGCDCTKLSRAGIPAIIFGPGSIDQAHTADEWVPLHEVEFAMDFYQGLIVEYADS